MVRRPGPRRRGAVWSLGRAPAWTGAMPRSAPGGAALGRRPRAALPRAGGRIGPGTPAPPFLIAPARAGAAVRGDGGDARVGRPQAALPAAVRGHTHRRSREPRTHPLRGAKPPAA